MKSNVTIGILTTGLILLGGCTHKIEKEIEKKVSQEANINTQSDLNAESEKVLESAKGITEEQRAKLIALREKTRSLTQEQSKESLRLKAVLMKELLASDYNRQEVNMIKNKIQKVENKKISILVDAIKETNSILGRRTRANDDRFENDFIIHDFNDLMDIL